MTGRHPNKLGVQATVIKDYIPWGIDLNETFLSQNLKEAGYKTALFGKWHLGMYADEYTPLYRGFDEHVGFLTGCVSKGTHIASCCTQHENNGDKDYVCPPVTPLDTRGYDWWSSLTKEAPGVATPDPTANHTSSAPLIGQYATDFIQQQAKKEEPFFLLLPFQNIHHPLTVDEKYRDLYSTYTNLTQDEVTIFGYISEMDAQIGEIITSLKDNGIYENSVIVYTSDNGAPTAGADVDHAYTRNETLGDVWYARNYPFRGWKSSLWEGGLRVPAFISSHLLPKEVHGTTNDQLFSIVDWLPTLASLGGASTKRNKPLDGINIWPNIQGSTNTPGAGTEIRNELLLSLNPLCEGGSRVPPQAAIRVGQYKLMTWCYDIEGILGANRTGPVNAPAGTLDYDQGPVLYNLDLDPSEANNIAQANPEVVAHLLERLKAHAEDPENVTPYSKYPPYQGDDYFCKDCPQRGVNADPVADAWAPWVNLSQVPGYIPPVPARPI